MGDSKKDVNEIIDTLHKLAEAIQEGTELSGIIVTTLMHDEKAGTVEARSASFGNLPPEAFAFALRRIADDHNKAARERAGQEDAGDEADVRPHTIQ